MNKPKLLAKQNGAPPLEGQRPEYFLSKTKGGLKVRHADVTGPLPARSMSVYFRTSKQQEELLRVWVFGCN